MRQTILACGMIKNELERAMEETGCHIPVRWLERGLHDDPKRLNQALKEQIAALEGETEEILLAFGACGGAADGLSSATARLVLPLFHDCIQMLLYQGEVYNRKDPRALYFTDRWTESEKFIGNEYAAFAARQGEETAQEIYQIMLEEYRSMQLVDTGCYDLLETERLLRPTAEALELELHTVSGSYGVLKALVSGDRGPLFYLAEPGQALTLTGFLERSAALSKRFPGK